MREFSTQAAIAFIVWTLWLFLIGPWEALSIFFEHSEVALTMLLGSFVAGSTSVGGGAVAFPIFTKVLHIDSSTALIFSLAIQSVGMTAASLFIFINKVPVCLRIIRYSIVIGGLGLLASFFIVRLQIASSEIKYLFSCFSFMVGIALLWSHFIYQENEPPAELRANSLLLSAGCFVGGMLSGIIGTGIDFILFTLMIFCWRYDFKKAIATSVVIMAINASVGFMAILTGTDLFKDTVVSYWLAAVPVVVFGAPLGALACRHIPKKIMVFFLLILIVLEILSTILVLGFRSEFIGALFIMSLGAVIYRNVQRRRLLTNPID